MNAVELWNQIARQSDAKPGKKSPKESLPFAELLRAEGGVALLRKQLAEKSGPHRRQAFFEGAVDYVKSDEFRRTCKTEPANFAFLEEVSNACGRWKKNELPFWELWLERCRLGGSDAKKSFAVELRELFRKNGGQYFQHIEGFDQLLDGQKIDLLQSALDAFSMANLHPEFCTKLDHTIGRLKQRSGTAQSTAAAPSPPPQPAQKSKPETIETTANTLPSAESSDTKTPPSAESSEKIAADLVTMTETREVPEPTPASDASVIQPDVPSTPPVPSESISPDSVTMVNPTAILLEPEPAADGPRAKKVPKTRIPSAVQPAADMTPLLEIGNRLADSLARVEGKLAAFSEVPAVLREMIGELCERKRQTAEIAEARSQIQSLRAEVGLKEDRLDEAIRRSQELTRELESTRGLVSAAENRVNSAASQIAAAERRAEMDIREASNRAESALGNYRAELTEVFARELVDIPDLPPGPISNTREDAFHRRLVKIRKLCQDKGILVSDPKRTT